MTSTRTLSPITLEVVRNGLLACTDEMAMGVLRTAYNMIIYEIHDYACALVDAQGRLIAQNLAGVPIFLADMGYIVQDGLATFGPDGFAPGDVILVNHPAACGQPEAVLPAPSRDGAGAGIPDTFPSPRKAETHK